MWNGVEFGNYDFEKDDLKENNWKFPTFMPPFPNYKDSKYVQIFNSSNPSLIDKTVKVSVKDVINEPSTSNKCTSTNYIFKCIPDFEGFVEYCDIFPFKGSIYKQ